MNKTRTYFFLFLTAISIQSLLWPLLITNDGTTYISSGYNLFTDFELTHYYWIREPVYPLFLRIMSLNTPLGLFTLKAIQTIFIYGSVFIIFELAARFFLIRVKVIHLILLFILITLTFDYSVYSSIVLQQAMMAFIGALFTLTIFLALEATSIKKLQLVIIYYLLLIFISVNLIVFYKYIPVIISPIFAWAFVRLKYKESIIKKYSTFLVLSTLLAFMPIVFSQPWLIYKQNALNTNSTNSALMASSLVNMTPAVEPAPTQPTPSEFDSDKIVVPENFRTTEFPDAVTVFNNYRNELRRNVLEFFQYQEDPYIKNENAFFVKTLIDNRSNCTFTISSKWYPFYEFTENFVSEFCLIQPNNGYSTTKVLNKVSFFSTSIFTIFSNIFIFIYVALLIKAGIKFGIYFIYPIIFAAAYIVSANTIDRYTIPVFPYYLSFSIIILILLNKRIRCLIYKS
jgi:hypothetical protein